MRVVRMNGFEVGELPQGWGKLVNLEVLEVRFVIVIVVVVVVVVVVIVVVVGGGVKLSFFFFFWAHKTYQKKNTQITI